MAELTRQIDASTIDGAISLLRTHVGTTETASFIDVLESLKHQPADDAYIERLRSAFDELGLTQGAVLTYAPFVATLLSDGLFGDD